MESSYLHSLPVGAAFLALALAGSQPTAWSIDDFEDGDRISASGLAWLGLSDSVTGGASRLELSIVAGGSEHSRKALRVAGTLAKGGFAGAWATLDGKGHSVDLSAFSGIRLRLRGEGDVLIGVRGGSMPFNNFLARHTAGREWSLVEVPFETLKTVARAGSSEARFDPRDVRWLGVQEPDGGEGEFAFEMDDVEPYGPETEASKPAQPVVNEGPALGMRASAGSLSEVAGAVWRELARDPAGDGSRPTLPDALALSFFDDETRELVWFRIDVASPPPAEGFGVNLAFDLDGRPDNGTAWWGTNKAFRFDRLFTGYVFASEGGYYHGVIGLADADRIASGEMADPRLSTPRLIVDSPGRAFFVGIPRAALGGSPDLTVVAAVGSSFLHNDDVPDQGAARLRH